VQQVVVKYYVHMMMLCLFLHVWYIVTCPFLNYLKKKKMCLCVVTV